MKYFVSAGEASGDLHASHLIKALRKADADASFVFLGGDEMAREAGCAPLIHYRDMAFMGFAEVLRNLRKVLGNLSTAKKALAESRPDRLILVDYPSFNLKLADEASRLGIPVYYYIAPKVWAWKQWRVKSMRRLCRKVLSILPFEVDFFRSHGLEVEYVGNPTVEEVAEKLRRLPAREEFLKRCGLSDDKPLLALVPGSRMAEIRSNLPVMTAVARRFPSVQPVVAAAPGIDLHVYSNLSPYPVVHDATFELVRNSAAALVTSGTATLEAALLRTPQIVCYRHNGSKLTYNLYRRLIHLDFVSLPNLIAGREVVPEMLMHRCTPNLVAEELARILPDAPTRDEMLGGYEEIARRLGDRHAATTAAEAILRDSGNL